MILSKRPKPVVLIVVDGLGVAPPGPGNAVTLAETKALDYLWPRFPHCYLHASGTEVGLPPGTDGNSEVGHMNIGAGKVVYQELPRIDMSITSGNFFKNSVLLDLVANVRKNKSKLHIMGCIGGGVVHSSINHLFALIKLAKENGLTGKDVIIHCFTDGRDSPPKSAQLFLEQVDSECKRTGVGYISTILGRSIAMDRDERWEKVEKAYGLITEGKGKKFKSFKEAILDNYANDRVDEYIDPSVIQDEEGKIYTVSDNDSLIFINFRSDRALQLSLAFERKDFNQFERKPIQNLFFVGMTEYEKNFPTKTAFPPEKITLPIGRVLSENGYRQLRISESEKFPHVTYFFDGGIEIMYKGEDRIEVPSPKDVATYDQKPEMSTKEIAEKVVEKASTGIYDFILVNFANVDMVAHTGVLKAGITAVQSVDRAIAKIVDMLLPLGSAIFITSDHGNAEEMIDLKTGEVDTKHSTNPVPFLYIANNIVGKELPFGRLSDVAPTILSVMGIQKSNEMTGRNLIS